MTDPQLPDLRNFRDIGGLRTADGRRVRPGLVHRSGTTAFVDEAQSRHLAELGIRTRIDLRSVQEVEESRNPALDAELTPVHLPIRAGGVWEQQHDVSHPSESVAAHYSRYLEHSGDSLRAAARLVADPDAGGFLVHCTAGKDRTGVVLAVLLSAVGVVREEIVADYAETRTDLDSLLLQLRELPAYKDRVQALPEESLTAEPESMERFLDRLEADHGGARAYLLTQGVTESELAALADALLT